MHRAKNSEFAIHQSDSLLNLNLLNTTDQQEEEPEKTLDSADLIHKIQLLKDSKQKLEEDLNRLKQLGKKPYNKTDPDATLMCKPAHHL